MNQDELKIKNLAIAMEALSRIGGRFRVDDALDRIERLLQKTISRLETEDVLEPAPTPSNLNDEIPF